MAPQLGLGIGVQKPWYTAAAGAPGAPGFLDGYLPTSAYGVKKIFTAYSGPCMEVTQAGGGTAFDVGFDATGLLDIALIASTLGASAGVVTKLYDQIGSDDLIGGGYKGGPQIYDGASVILDSGGLPAINTEGASSIKSYFIATLSFSPSATHSIFQVGETDSTSHPNIQFSFSHQSDVLQFVSHRGSDLHAAGDSRNLVRDGATFDSLYSTNTVGIGDGVVSVHIVDGTSWLTQLNATAAATKTAALAMPTTNMIYMGWGIIKRGAIEDYYSGLSQCLLVFNGTDETANKDDIRSKLNTAFSKY